jgi:hypothetical protein
MNFAPRNLDQGRGSKRSVPARRSIVSATEQKEKRRRTMDFRVLERTEREQLREALRRNADLGCAILTDPKDTSFRGTAEEVPDEEVISAIRSVPYHY